MRVDYSARSGGIIGIIFFIFFNMKVCCVFSLESPHRGDSNEYAQYAIINVKKKITLNYPKYNNVCCYGIFSRGLKNEFETAVVNEPSVFEPLKFYCKCHYITSCETEVTFENALQELTTADQIGAKTIQSHD